MSISSSALSRRQFLQASAAATALPALRGATGQKPNIVFLMADEHRYDALGCAGNAAVKTPNLDRLAGQGVRFSNTYCQGPLCQPSRASIITGQYVHQHGQTWNRFNMKQEWPTMMKQLQKAGYETAMVGKTHFAGEGTPGRSPDMRQGQGQEWNRGFGLDWLVEEYDKPIHLRPGITTPYTAYLKSKGLLETYLEETPRGAPDMRGYYAGKTSKLPLADMQSSFIGDQVVDWLQHRKADKPFFMWASFVEPHPPIIDNATWADRYRGAKMPTGPVVMPELPDNAYGRYMRTWIKQTGTADFTADGAAEMARHYFGMVSLVDQKIGDILKAVQDRGWDKDTLFIYTSDHGEMMGDHKMVFKNVFYKGSVRVPCIVRPPGGIKAQTSDALVQSIDLTATMLEAAGTELPGCKGQSLMPLVKGNGKSREVAYSELAGHQNKGNFFVMAATKRYRYLYDKENDIACELFDLEKDPDELHNLVNEPGMAGIRKDLHKDYTVPFMAS